MEKISTEAEWDISVNAVFMCLEDDWPSGGGEDMGELPH
jgi:hypothetical protein